jgi:phosphoribosyl-ATP pyrophosphohydrolase
VRNCNLIIDMIVSNLNDYTLEELYAFEKKLTAVIKEKQPTLSKLHGNIIEWANEKGINNPEKQFLKVIEELGEFTQATLRGDREDIKNEMGDIIVTVIILYSQENYNLNLSEFHSGVQPSVKAGVEEFLCSLVDRNIDVLLSISELARTYDTSMLECLNMAWNKIKDRKGKTVGGTFIKE